MKNSSFLALLIVLCASPALFARVWTDRQGRQTDAQFVRVRGDSVVLQKGLKPLIVPLSEFSDEDQEYIKGLTAGKGGAKTPAAKKADDAPDDAASSTPAAKPKKPAAAADNPFLTDEEKAAAKDDKNEPKAKPGKTEKAEKDGPPKITANGGFDERTWTDIKGNKLTANFSRLDGKVVVLLKNGAEQRFALDQFCYDDKLYIRQAAVELQKYQQFAGNRENPNSPGAAVAQATPAPPMPVPGIRQPMPGMFGPPGGGMLQAMQQQAAARQQQFDEDQRRAAAEREQQRQQAEQFARQQEADRQRIAEQHRRDQEERDRQIAEQRSIAQQQAQQQAQQMATPDFQPAGVPISSPIVPTEQKYCMSCKKPVPNTSKAGDRCPHCGIVWDVEEDAHGKIVGETPYYRYGGYGGLGTAIAVGIGALFRWLRRRD